MLHNFLLSLAMFICGDNSDKDIGFMDINEYSYEPRIMSLPSLVNEPKLSVLTDHLFNLQICVHLCCRILFKSSPSYIELITEIV